MATGICPKCGKQAEKVSAVVAAGTSIGSGTGHVEIDGGWKTVETTTITESILASTLSLPPRPSYPLFTVGFVIFGFIFVGMTFILPIVAAVIYVIVGFLGNSSKIGEIGEVPPEVPMVIAMAFIIPIMGFGIIWFLNSIRRDAMSKYKASLPIWEIAKQRWESLYYCNKHDIVFNSELKEYFQRDRNKLMTHIYKGLG
jgi:hypothetical protein